MRLMAQEHEELNDVALAFTVWMIVCVIARIILNGF